MTLSLSDTVIETNSTMDTFYNFTDLMPNIPYEVRIFTTSIDNMCSGIPNETMVTTLTVEAGVPQSALVVVNMYLY